MSSSSVPNHAAESIAPSGLPPQVYAQLRALASRCFRQLPPGHTVQPTVLVHEVYLRLSAAKDVDWKDRTHFLAVAAKAMRQILLNYVRTKRAQKRGGRDWHRITLDGNVDAMEPNTVDIVAIDEVLKRLAALSERQAQVVEMRVFGGASIEETAEALGIGVTTVKSDWLIARAWLRRELSK